MKKKMIVNSLVSFMCQVIILAMAMVIPRIVMINYGSDTNGLTGTVTQIFAYMALLASGIGQATQNALHRYIGLDDRHGISRVMSVSRRYYRKASYVYAIFVVIIAAILPFVIKTDVEGMTVSLYFLFGGLVSLMSFYFTSLWIVFLNASGKSYITNIISLLSRALIYAAVIILSLNKVNIAVIQLGCFLVSFIPLFLYFFYMKKKFPWIDYRLSDNDEKLPDRRAYVGSEVAWIVFASTDMIILSVFVSTSASSIYATYSMVFVAFETLLNEVYYSLNYLLGYTYHNKIDEYEKVHDIFNSVFIGASVIILSVIYRLIIPFIRMYTSGVRDADYILIWLPLGFCLVKLLSRSRMVAGNLTGLSGHAKRLSVVSVIEAFVNIILSIVLLKWFGIYGVLYATVAALLIKTIYINYFADSKIMKRSCFHTCSIFFGNLSVFIMTVCFQYHFPLRIDTYKSFVLNGVVLVFVYFIIVLLINIMINKSLREFLTGLITGNAKKYRRTDNLYDQEH